MPFLKFKVFWVALVLGLLVILSFWGRTQYLKRKASQDDLRARLSTYGDGRFKDRLSKMSQKQIEEVYVGIPMTQCQAFVEMVTDGDYYSGTGIYAGSLDLHVADPARMALSKISGVDSEEVWEGLKEINSFVPVIHSLNDEIESNLSFLDRISSIGVESGMTEREQEGHAKAVGDETDQAIKENGKYGEEIQGLEEQMRELAALTLKQVPESRRESVLKVLEENLEE